MIRKFRHVQAECISELNAMAPLALGDKAKMMIKGPGKSVRRPRLIHELI